MTTRVTVRDFDRDRELFTDLPRGEWESGYTSTLDVNLIPSGSDVHYVGCGEALTSCDIAYISRYHTNTVQHAIARFFAEAKDGWKAALDEIKILQGVIHDMQQESTAYQQGQRDGFMEGQRSLAERLTSHVTELQEGGFQTESAEHVTCDWIVNQMRELTKPLVAKADTLTLLEKAKQEGRDEAKAEIEKLQSEVAGLRRKLNAPIPIDMLGSPTATKSISVTYDRELEVKKLAYRQLYEELARELLPWLEQGVTFVVQAAVNENRPVDRYLPYVRELIGTVRIKHFAQTDARAYVYPVPDVFSSTFSPNKQTDKQS